MRSSEPRAMTTAGLQAKVALRGAWFESHPNQPMPEGRAEVERHFAAIEREAAASPSVDVETQAIVDAARDLVTSDGWDTFTEASGQAAQRLIRALAGLPPREVGLPPSDPTLIGTEYKPLIRFPRHLQDDPLPTSLPAEPPDGGSA